MNNVIEVITADSKKGSILRKQCNQVQIPEEQTAANMIIELLKEVLDSNNNAAGIAAPQIGFNKQIAAIHKSVMGKNEHLILINPSVKTIGPDTITESESCLSFPGLSKRIKRHKNITVSTLLSTKSGSSATFKLSELSARAVQHEVDHLNGITILDK